MRPKGWEEQFSVKDKDIGGNKSNHIVSRSARTPCSIVSGDLMRVVRPKLQWLDYQDYKTWLVKRFTRKECDPPKRDLSLSSYRKSIFILAHMWRMKKEGETSSTKKKIRKAVVWLSYKFTGTIYSFGQGNSLTTRCPFDKVETFFC